MINKILVLVIFIIFLMSFSISYSEVTNVINNNNTENTSIHFIDVPSYWATESIYWAVNEGLVSGYPDGTYKPKAQITEAEFATILARYASNIDIKKLSPLEGKHWSQHIYNELARYQLPFNGYANDVTKNTALTRGQIAKIIAAKNGFNLTEQQAIYYMYENDLSYGLISGRMDFESYGADQPVLREQMPAFFKRLDSKGVTTFMGKPAPVQGRELHGVVGVTINPDLTVDFSDFKDKIEEVYGPQDTEDLTNVSVGDKVTIAGKEFIVKAPAQAKSGDIVLMGDVLAPYDASKTRLGGEESGMVIIAILEATAYKRGFQDKEVFIETIAKGWTKYLDDNQIKEFTDWVNTHYDQFGSGQQVFKGEKYNMILTKGLSVGIAVYEKGYWE